MWPNSSLWMVIASAISAIGQQLLGGSGVVGKARVECRVEAVDPRRDHQSGDRSRAAHHLGLDRLLVDRLIERLAHAHVLEGVLAPDAAPEQLVARLVEA